MGLNACIFKKTFIKCLYEEDKTNTFQILASGDCYIDLPEIVKKVKLNLFSS